MDTASLVVLLLLAAGASYVQTLTGFALGLLMMGGVGLTGLVPLPDAAVLVGILGLVNAAQVLAKGWRDIARREFLLVIFISLAFLVLGYWLLGLLLAASLDWLKLVLGAIIILSSLQLLLRPTPFATPSGPGSFVFFGAIAGVMGGLFSTAGPPLVYHFYRQPLRAVSIRETLVAIFAVNGLLRLVLVGLAGNMPSASFWWGLLCIPVVMAFTLLARRYPPPLTPMGLRRVAFCLLFLSGISLAGPAFLKLFGDLS
ncbi:TSUP family transporter [Shinella sp.]|uniref:TSUP family transporter n=1 Tax=Shinella sp. TaxID=1870904 RepID=UPI002588D6D5|nr:TSUP family transporter [Shinella sp.]MCW5711403.1 TSUP family transporter [Shinella sp.]